MSAQNVCLHRPVHVLIALAVAFLSALPPASAARQEAPVPAELRLNTTARHAAIEPEPGAVAAVRFQIDIPEAGLLGLNLTVAGGASVEPLLRLIGLPETSRRLVQTPTELLIEARGEETLLLEVAALEPDQSLPAFKLRSAFRAADSPMADRQFAKDVDPWDDDLGGKKPPSSGDGAAVLCGLGEVDDHGDTPLCATPISSGKSLAGVLHNDAGDDEDLFRVSLAETAVLAFEVASEAPLQLVLRDGDGLPVATAHNEERGGPLRLARALAAGRYFLEVESPNGDGAEYRLILRLPSRR